MDEQDIVLYTNSKGGVAISIDGGETLMIADGRTLPVGETVWTEGDVDESRLSEVQTRYIEDARASTGEMTELQKIAANLRRGRKTHESEYYRPKEPIKRKLPESALVIAADFD